MNEMDRIGPRSVLACPDCGGVMWELEEGELIRYRSHVGHAYTAELMAVALDEGIHRALGIALRALEERGALAKKLHAQAVSRGHNHSAHDWEQKVREFEQQQNVIRSSMRRMQEIAARYDQK